MGNDIVDSPKSKLYDDSEYDAVKHLADFLFAFDATERIMAMITAYFDESYSHPPVPVVYTIAGYVSTTERWQEFQRQWKSVLDRENLPPFLMKDFDNPYSKNFGNWEMERKISFLQELHKIIKDTYIRSFSTSVIQEDYDALSVEGQFGFGKPHPMAAINCLKYIVQWADKENLQEPILYVFEKGSKDDKFLTYLFNESLTEEIQLRYRIEKLGFDTKNLSPLQAADILAYETRKETARCYFTSDKNIRNSIKNLHDPARDEWRIMDIIHMEQVTNNPLFRDSMNSEEFKLAANLAKERGVI